MQRTNSLSRTATAVVLALVFGTFSAVASADEARAGAPATAAVASHKPLQNFGKKLMKHGGGFGKQTIHRLKAIGQRVADHMIARPEDLADLDEIAVSVAEQAPEMLADEARNIKRAVMSDAVRETVDTIARAAN